MRQRNLSRVLHALAAEGPLSRATVATRIGLTRAAVSTLVDELLRAGLVTEQRPGRSGTVGRPGTALLLADRGPCGFGAEIGVDRLAVCAMDLRGAVRARISRSTRGLDTGPEAVLGRLGELLHRLIEEAAALGLQPHRVTVAVPGLVARSAATVMHAPNLGWRDVDLGGLMPAGLGPLTVDNEANLGALAELWAGGHSPAPDSFIHVSAEIGIGAAVIVDGELLRGAHGFAGELGHVPVQPDGRDCSCGGRGCLETYAGTEALLRAAGVDPDPGVRVDALSSRCTEGDATALRAVRQAGTALGVALSGAVNLLDPRQVVVGGALARLAPWLLPPLRSELTRRTAVAEGGRPTPLPVTASRFGQDGPLLGAAHSAVRGVLDAPPRPAPQARPAAAGRR
ncbi:ROK family transcriptional regulator [Streptomyces sp. ACA25]|uniref:ROK family transcriptional regulator n=1 Tax=Streptomyces sp. ACA25 TaxID=3022596 RepID=UPI002307102F|nr:ROK family transcriptional regulator [Streptomyces sp. ACA25]MDB1090121.1 ROK family transcriptional regulator [Streptomyces sp. ACA25]